MSDSAGQPRRWRDRLLWLAIGFLLAVAVLLLTRSEKLTPADAPLSPRSSSSTIPEPSRRVPPARRHLGVVLAGQAVDVAAEIRGRVERIHVRAGDPVEHGQKIATLDTRDLRQELAIGQADLASAEAKARQIALEVERSEHEHERRLALGGLVSKEDAESAEFQVADAELRFEAAAAERDQVKARIEQLESNLARSEIRAPFAGEIALRYVDSGAVVPAGTPVARLISSSGLLVRFAVAPEEAMKIELGAPVAVDIESLEQAVTATISQISPEIDSASHLVFIEAQVASGPAAGVPAGSVARVSVLKPDLPD